MIAFRSASVSLEAFTTSSPVALGSWSGWWLPLPPSHIASYLASSSACLFIITSADILTSTHSSLSLSLSLSLCWLPLRADRADRFYFFSLQLRLPLHHH